MTEELWNILKKTMKTPTKKESLNYKEALLEMIKILEDNKELNSTITLNEISYLKRKIRAYEIGYKEALATRDAEELEFLEEKLWFRHPVTDSEELFLFKNEMRHKIDKRIATLKARNHSPPTTENTIKTDAQIDRISMSAHVDSQSEQESPVFENSHPTPNSEQVETSPKPGSQRKPASEKGCGELFSIQIPNGDDDIMEESIECGTLNWQNEHILCPSCKARSKIK